LKNKQKSSPVNNPNRLKISGKNYDDVYCDVVQGTAHLGASQYNVIPLVHGGIQSQGLQSGTHCCQVLFPAAKITIN
jgi:hypothetical protein